VNDPPVSQADEAVALSARERAARLDVAQNPARDQSGDLNARHIVAFGGSQMKRIALVLKRRLVEGGIEKAAGVIPGVDDAAVDRTAVRMNIEHVHEHADLESIAVEVGIAALPDGNDLAVGG
jgi:hypothetical protein